LLQKLWIHAVNPKNDEFLFTPPGM
jgi:hypothetical protein